MCGRSPIIVILPRFRRQHWPILHSLDLCREDWDQIFHKWPCQCSTRTFSPHSQCSFMGCMADHPSKHACKPYLKKKKRKKVLYIILKFKGNLVISHARRRTRADESEPEVQRSVLQLRDHVRHGQRPVRGGGVRLRPHFIGLVPQFLHQARIGYLLGMYSTIFFFFLISNRVPFLYTYKIFQMKCVLFIYYVMFIGNSVLSPSILPNGMVHREERPSLRVGVQPLAFDYRRHSQLGPT